MIKDNEWDWPIDWDDRCGEVTNVSIPKLVYDLEYKSIWLNKKGMEKMFSVKDVWKAVSNDYPKVIWKEWVFGSVILAICTLSKMPHYSGCTAGVALLYAPGYDWWMGSSRPNGKLIQNSILNGPYVRRMIPEPGDANREQMMKGSDIGIQEKKAKLFNEWERFTFNERELIESYYHRFLKLMNDLERNKHFPEKIAGNLKFLNNLQPEWSRHVTIVHQTKDLHTADYTQLYDFLKYNQKEVDELKAERLAKNQDPLALMANSNNPYAFPVSHQDQSSFNQNYLQQPMPNPEDITDPTTAMNMALALMAKAFKLNYSTPTNNNQRISSNPRNRQIAQPGMNMGQDRQIQMVGGYGGNQFRQYAWQNAGNSAGYNDVIGNQDMQNAVQNLRVQNVGNQNGLIGVQRNGNRNQIGNGNLVVVRAEENTAGHNGNQISDEFPLPEEVPTVSEEKFPLLKKRDATAEKFALLMETRVNRGQIHIYNIQRRVTVTQYKTAQELWAAILKTFDGNEATKKTKKNLLKQQYGNFKEKVQRLLSRLLTDCGS
nr:Gag-Pol polyprotein [Tanacetum cinerariifolium]